MEEKDIRLVYDAVCYDVMRMVYVFSKDVKRIAFKNFDHNNGDHKLVLAVTMACWGILGSRDVAIDDNIFTRIKLSRRYKKLCKIRKTRKTDEKIIDIKELIPKIYQHAKNMGENVRLEAIYNEYYKER